MQEGNAVRGIEGTFRLVRCEVRWSDGEVNWPYGEDAEGLLVYTSTGFVTGHLMRRNVPKFRTGARRAPSEQIHEAFLGLATWATTAPMKSMSEQALSPIMFWAAGIPTGPAQTKSGTFASMARN